MSVANEKLMVSEKGSTKYLVYKSIYSGSRFYMYNHLLSIDGQQMSSN